MLIDIVLIILIIFLLFYRTPIILPNDSQKIKTLVRQTSRWSVASEQDNNIFVANLHANYGMGYLQALKDIYSQKEIESVMNINLKDFTKRIVSIQDKAARNLISNCPNIRNKNVFLAELAGE